MSRIEKRFQQSKSEKRTCRIIYLTCGYPDLRSTEKLIPELDKAGVDIIELGFPFSDPVADGPIIQIASQKALENNYSVHDYFQMVKRVRRETAVPLVIMTYANIILHYGMEKAVLEAKQSGIDGFILPDLPVEDSRTFTNLCRSHGMDFILLATETSPEKRLKKISSQSSGFLYVVSQPGTTGKKLGITPDLYRLARKLRKMTSTPLAVGFGISTRQDILKLQDHFDGIIIGSAFIKKLLDHNGKIKPAIEYLRKIFK